MRKILSSIICAFIPGRKRRRRIRVRLRYPIIKQMAEFAKSFSSSDKPQIKYTYGFRAANFVVTVDNKWVFKFPLSGNAREISLREQRITDALRPISPIKIPKMEILNWRGMYVRKYEFVNGAGFRTLPKADQKKFNNTVAKQLAKFFYVVGHADPEEIRDLKVKSTEKPGIMYGWNQNDLWDNFLVNPYNGKVTCMIDWEGAGFNDFCNSFTGGTGNDAIKTALLREYLNLLKN